MQLNTTVVSIATVFFNSYFFIAIIIATYGQKTLHWQLRKVILSGMYNCNFEVNKLENEKIRNGIWTIHLYNHLLPDTLYKI